MAKLDADEQFPRPAVESLRSLSHDVLTVQEAGQAGSSDAEVLAFAIAQNRTVLTQNRRDFVRLHRSQPDHIGIIICSENRSFAQLAQQIHQVILAEEPLQGKLVRVKRPAESS